MACTVKRRAEPTAARMVTAVPEVLMEISPSGIIFTRSNRSRAPTATRTALFDARRDLSCNGEVQIGRRELQLGVDVVLGVHRRGRCERRKVEGRGARSCRVTSGLAVPTAPVVAPSASAVSTTLPARTSRLVSVYSPLHTTRGSGADRAIRARDDRSRPGAREAEPVDRDLERHIAGVGHDEPERRETPRNERCRVRRGVAEHGEGWMRFRRHRGRRRTGREGHDPGGEQQPTDVHGYNGNLDPRDGTHSGQAARTHPPTVR